MQVIGRGRTAYPAPAQTRLVLLSRKHSLLPIKSLRVGPRSSHSSCNNSLEQSPSKKPNPLFSFAPDRISSPIKPKVPSLLAFPLCPKCNQAGSLCFHCHRNVIKFRNSVQPQPKKATRNLRMRGVSGKQSVKQTKPYLADLDLSALKQKLAGLHLKWPEGSPVLPTGPIERSDSGPLRKASVPNSSKQLVTRTSIDTAVTNTSSTHILSKARRDSADPIHRKPSFSPSNPNCKSSLDRSRRNSLKPITASPCISYIVDLQICRDCSSQELHRLSALQELAEKLEMARNAGSILKHKIDLSAAPWIEEDLPTPEINTRCVKFGDLPDALI